jgi:hypothetical protein
MRTAQAARPAGAGAPPKKKSSAGCIIGGCLGLLVIVVIIIVVLVLVVLPKLGDPINLFEKSITITSEGTPVSKNTTPDRLATRTPGTARATIASTSDVLYEDDFEDVDSGWDTWDDTEAAGGYEDGMYAIEVKEVDTFYWANAGQDFSDFVLDVDATKLNGVDNNHFGVIFRYQDSKNFYMFGLASDGYYHFGYYKDDEWTYITEWTETGAISAGEALNHITVRCEGSTFTLIVNGEELATITDRTYDSGDIGFYVGTIDDAPVKLAFDNLVVSPVE